METLRGKKGFICDMDGVIYHGNRLLPGVKEFVEWLYREQKNFLFLTNSSERSPKELQQKLKRMGLDVDESHFYKNLFLTTKMRNVAGLSTSEAQKSSDMFGKCRYLDEITGGRGVVFATGTPVSNSMTELYTVMRYLQYSTLQQKKLTHFDAWASTFGETTTAIELAPEGYT